jgi:hypothetical protein
LKPVFQLIGYGFERLWVMGQLDSNVQSPTSEYLLVRHEPSASITGAEVKFSDAISSMPRLLAFRVVVVGSVGGGRVGCG